MTFSRHFSLAIASLLTIAVTSATRAATPPDNSVKTDPQRLERIRSAPPVPIKKPIPFDTPEADAILAGLEVFPPDNHWNVLVEDWPLHPDSAHIIEAVGPDLPFRMNPDMNFILVNSSQKKIKVPLWEFPDESDTGPYPVPDNTPIEGWPVNYLDAVDDNGKKLPPLTLDQHQRDLRKEGGDRHALVIDVQAGKLYEFYQMKKSAEGWSASCAAIFDLRFNTLRPETWTSADAAGLPIFPAVIRYDELQRGVIDHALRVTFRKTRRAYAYPARHFASNDEDPSLPRMGERFRLRSDFDDSDFSPHAKTIITTLKRYGMLVADNGLPWAVSSTPDPRMPNLHAELRKIKGTDFEVILPPKNYPQPE
jgi:hypothetical protein